MMKKISVLAFVAAAIVAAGFSFLPAKPAFAQSGHRMCGRYTTFADGGGIALVSEKATKYANYNTYCKTVTDTVMDKIKADPTLNSYTWTSVYGDTCESVGQHFTDATHTSTDMCDNMTDSTNYKVVKSGGVTTYTKL